MTSIPSNLTRVPNILASKITLGGLTSTNAQLLRLQTQLSTLKRVNRPSDDPVSASLVNVLDQQLEASGQRARNLSHASSLLGVLDQRVGAINDMVLESKTIASGQLSGSSDGVTRASQATVIDSMIKELYSSLNDDYVGLSLFAGSLVGGPAVETFESGYRYMGDREGLRTDLGGHLDFPLTLSADDVVGSFSGRMEGAVDLNPTLTPETLLKDLRGPMTGVDEMGSISVTINATTTIQIDLSEAETVGDAMNMIESGIRGTGIPALQFAYPNGIEIDPTTGNRLRLNVAGINTIAFSDGPTGQSASALGLDSVTYTFTVGADLSAGADLNPRVTDRTLIGSMSPSTALDLGSTMLIRNGNRTGTVTVTAGMSVGELREAVRRLDIGVRVEINESGDSIDFINEVAGTRMSIEETGGGTIATTLGVRTMTSATPLSIFNDGRGVEIADNEVDENGNPDPFRNVDFEVALSDGTTFTVDLVPGDTTSVAGVLAKINAEAAAAGLTIGNGPGEFQARMDPNGNGLVLEDFRGGAAPVKVTSLNGYAAADMGFLDGAATTGTPATLTGSDRTSVRVESLFTTLIDLRDSLEADDPRGITFAGERLEADLDRLNRARALVGGRAQRVEESEQRLEDKAVLDASIKSELQDLDFFEASSRLTLLQTQLQASIQVAAQSVPLSLLNFL